MATRDVAVRERTLALVQSYQTLIAQRRFDEWIELWAEDGSCEFPYAPKGHPGLLQGREAIYRYMTAYPERIAIDAVAEMRVHPMLDPEMATVELAIVGHVLPGGRPYNQRYVVIFQVKNGKLWRYREYWNPLISIEAFGGMDAWLSHAPAGEGGEPS
jgi:hypothetical protein